MNDGPQDARERESRSPVRYTTWVGFIFLAVVAYATYNTITSEEPGLLGAGGPERGWPLPHFAVPDLRTDLVGDANIFQRGCETSRDPCPEDEVTTRACRIEEERAIRVCDLFDRPLAISFWFTRGGDCLPAQDAFDAVARAYEGRVNFLSVNVHDDHDEAARIVRERGWSVPVGWDRDGAVSNIYSVGVCPTIALAYPGGVLHEAHIGLDAVDEPALREAIEELLRATRSRSGS